MTLKTNSWCATRYLVATTALCTAVFAACISVAIALYPGGTWFDPHAHGHSFTKNFLCDLMQTRALNGEVATFGAPIARMGVFVMLFGLAAFFALISRSDSHPTTSARVTRLAGTVACIFGCAIPLAPSDRFREAHVIAVLGAFAPALVAIIAALLVCLRSVDVSRTMRVLAVATVATIALDGIAYGYDYAWAYSCVPLVIPRELLEAFLPACQRAGTIALIAWVLSTCVYATRLSS